MNGIRRAKSRRCIREIRKNRWKGGPRMQRADREAMRGFHEAAIETVHQDTRYKIQRRSKQEISKNTPLDFGICFLFVSCFLYLRDLGMRVCILQTVLDPYKGANHLPLFAATSEISFTIVCNRSKARKEDLPSNVDVITVPGRTGPYYYGCADTLFARSVLRRYPVSDPFWKSFDVLHLNQVMGPAFRRLQGSGVPVLFTIHHPVTADREIALQESGTVQGILWRMKYATHFLAKADVHLVQSRDDGFKTVSDRLNSEYHCPPDRISIVPNGVDGMVLRLPLKRRCLMSLLWGRSCIPAKDSVILRRRTVRLQQRATALPTSAGDLMCRSRNYGPFRALPLTVPSIRRRYVLWYSGPPCSSPPLSTRDSDYPSSKRWPVADPRLPLAGGSTRSPCTNRRIARRARTRYRHTRTTCRRVPAAPGTGAQAVR